ncbi:MAG TPA: hypothetical protein VFE46_04280 [Pirellulales bacterium]|jgi:hypothetical protein|nr:hypothetical protein [Pirellulales bacterium]
MRIADLTSGAAKIAAAHKSLRLNWEATKEHWHDENRVRFEEKFLDPLEPQLQAALDAIGALAEVLGRAERECE